MSLEPLDPETARELYLSDRENEVTQATLYSHNSRLGHFIRWCEKEDIENLNELTGRRIHEYRLWRRTEGDLAPASEKTQMDTIRVFVKWLESVDAVEPDLHSKVRSPTLTGKDNIRDVMLEAERAEEILDYLSTYEYASRRHVALALMWHTFLRVGALHALDLDDYDSEEQSLEVVHRPASGTPIKNAEAGERYIALAPKICSLLNDWIENQRPNITDDHNRQPLLTTRRGRAHKTTLRSDCYQYTRPCEYTNNCPHNRDIDQCPATAVEKAAKCPSSVSPHPVRRGGITNWLTNDIPKPAVAARGNCSTDVLDKHYDQRSEREKMEQRRHYLNNI